MTVKHINREHPLACACYIVDKAEREAREEMYQNSRTNSNKATHDRIKFLSAWQAIDRVCIHLRAQLRNTPEAWTTSNV